MEKGYSVSDRPLSEGVASAHAPTNANESISVPPVRESGTTNGVGVPDISHTEIPVSGYYEGVGERPRSPLFLLITLGLALIGWLTTLVSQAVVAATIDNALVRILWFGFIIQTFSTFLVLGIILGIISAYEYGIQIAIFTSLATGFAVLGVDRNIYSSTSSQQATGAGWLILSIVDLLWILYFTSPPQSPFTRIVTSFGSQVQPPRTNPVQKISRSTDAFAMGAMHGGNARMSQNASAQQTPNQKPVTVSGNWSGTPLRNTVGSIPGTEARGHSVVGSGHEEAPATPAQRPPSQTMTALPDSGAKWRAEAIFDYKGNKDDPNELAFKKGDILLVYDTTSKWWEAKTSDGKQGIAPSNYLKMI